MNGEENDSSEEWIPVNSSGSSGSSVDFMEGHLSNDDDDNEDGDDDDDDNMMWVTDSD